MDKGTKMRVVLLTDCLAYLTGGAERQIFELAKRINKDQFEVFVCSLEAEGCAPREKIEEAGCHIATFPVKRIYGFSGLVQAWKFYRFLRREKIDVLMTYHFGSDIWGTVVGAIILGIINNMLNLLGVSPYLQGTVKGAVILIAVLVQFKSNR